MELPEQQTLTETRAFFQENEWSGIATFNQTFYHNFVSVNRLQFSIFVVHVIYSAAYYLKTSDKVSSDLDYLQPTSPYQNACLLAALLRTAAASPNVLPHTNGCFTEPFTAFVTKQCDKSYFLTSNLCNILWVKQQTLVSIAGSLIISLDVGYMK